MPKKFVRIGIDGDVDKSGYCELSKEPFGKWKIDYMGTLDFFDLIENLKSAKELAKDPEISVMVYIEGGWLNKSIHHVMKGNAHAASIGTKVGANHQIGKLLVEFCTKIGLPYTLYKPTTTKWNAKTFQMVTGCKERTNPEIRDAVRAAWG